MAGVDKEYGVFAGGAPFAPVQKPEGAGQGHGQEKVGANGNHHVHRFGLDELLADVQFGLAGVAGGVGHDKTGPAVLVEGAVENLNPQIVGIVHPRQAKGKARAILEAVLVHPVDVKGRVAITKSNLSRLRWMSS